MTNDLSPSPSQNSPSAPASRPLSTVPVKTDADVFQSEQDEYSRVGDEIFDDELPEQTDGAMSLLERFELVDWLQHVPEEGEEVSASSLQRCYEYCKRSKIPLLDVDDEFNVTFRN
ncbi:hypothetical protein BT69DRAFT_1288682 [Atractiella rhizophila]|nr:hypothetical protein BT69DRAFT_1288682 [Atractiella rhizophila]